MAGIAKHRRLIVGIVAAVLLAHWAALAWLQAQWQATTQLRPLATPMYTRLLMQTATVAPPAAAPAKPAAVRPARALAAVASPAVGPANPPSPSPSNSGQTPLQPEPEAQAPLPQTVASAPASPSVATAPPPTPAASAPAVNTAGAGNATPITPTSPPTATTTASTSPGPTDLWPADTRLSYRLSGYFRGDLHGDARVQWQRSGARYQVRIEADISVLASLTMTSQGIVSEQGLVPDTYEEIVRGRRRGAQMDDTQITLQNGSKVARPAGVQDTASQFVELAHQFASGRTALAPGRQVQFWMARPGAVDLWTYDMLEEVTLHTPSLGAVRAVHLKPRPIANPRGNIVAEMWFAPSLQYLPVRIRIQVGDGNYVDLLVERIEQR
jgi:outer membrane biosynthesis protein TonB